MNVKFNGYTYALFATPANKNIIRELEAGDAKVFLFPAIETEPLDLDAARTELIKGLTKFDWIIFPDVLAVDHFVATLLEMNVDLFELDHLRVLASGEAVADRLRFSELHADIIAGSTAPEKVFGELHAYLAGEDLSDLKFLIPKAESVELQLARILRHKRAEVSELPIYTIKSMKDQHTTKIKALLSGGAIDEFIFSDPLDLLALKHFFPEFELKEILVDVKISATDQIMFQALLEAGLAASFFYTRSQNYLR